MFATCTYMQHLDLLSQHPDENTSNIRLIQMKHLEHTLETYEYSHYNMCNIPIYFCNIDIQHLQHISETLKTYSYNMRFQHTIYLLLGRTEARRREARSRGVAREGRGMPTAGWLLAPASGCAATDELLRGSRRKGERVRPPWWRRQRCRGERPPLGR